MSPSYNTMYWGAAPSTTCLKLWEFADPSTFNDILVLGAGDGRNPLFLASQGYKVTVADNSEQALDKLHVFAKEQNIQINAQLLDISKDDLGGLYDIIISVGIAHTIPKELRKQRFEYFESITKPGGFHAFSAFVGKPFIEPMEFEPMTSGELLSYYHPWRIHWTTQELFRSDTKKVFCVDRIIAQNQVGRIEPSDITQPLGII